MIRPMNFGYNAETAESNSFQSNSALPDSDIQKRALKEFEALARKIDDAGIGLKVFNDTALPQKPDAIFPNNWFSTHTDGTVILYPMQSPSRRLERREDMIEWLRHHYRVSRIIDLTYFEDQEKFLEGTGSLVFDHSNKMVYASVSARTHAELVEMLAGELNFSFVCFRAVDRSKAPIYHTNVVMSVSNEIAVVCLESVAEGKEKLRQQLLSSGRELLELNYHQLENFAGNMLMLRNSKGGNAMVMSERAFRSINTEQVKLIEKYAEIVCCDVNTIEQVGGGSVRCMLAEVFLEKRTNT
jgi:hypothetical protein